MPSASEILSQHFGRDVSENGEIDAFKYLFGNCINTIKTLDNEVDYCEHNWGTCNCGVHHSVTASGNADKVASYLIDNGAKSHLDVGASRAVLSNKLLFRGVDSYAIEGSDYGWTRDIYDVPKDRYAVFDVTSCDMSEFDLFKRFDFTTAFEVTEHIPPDLIDIFYKNMQFLSKEHFCSVHHGGQDHTQNEHSNHYLIRDLGWWIDFLTPYCTSIQPLPMMLDDFGESALLHLKFH